MARVKRVSYDEVMNESVKEDKKINMETSPAEVETDGPETKNGIVENSLHVKVRKEPSYESDVLEVLRKGDKVNILGKSGEFYKVSTKVNKIAYISSDFIKED